MSSLNYPNLENCEIQITTSTGGKQLPPPSPDPECIEAMNAPLLKLYDFHVEKRVLSRETTTDTYRVPNASAKKQRLNDSLIQMMNITEGSEEDCARILEAENYDLERAINAFMNNGS